MESLSAGGEKLVAAAPPAPHRFINGDPAYFWRKNEGGDGSNLIRGLVIDVADDMVKVFVGEVLGGENALVPLADVYPTYIDAVEFGGAKGHRFPEKREPKPKPSIEVWVCGGCHAVEPIGPLDQRVQLNAAITLRRQKCRKCKDEMLLEKRGGGYWGGEKRERIEAGVGEVRGDASGTEAGAGRGERGDSELRRGGAIEVG